MGRNSTHRGDVTAVNGKAAMDRRGFLKAVGTTAVAASVGGLGLLKPERAWAGQRPLSDWLNNQGQTSTFWPPVPDYLGWAPKTGFPFALVDYAGVANKWLVANGGPDLGTTISGSVTERPLADGRAEVTVLLHTMRALAFAVDGGYSLFTFTTLLFGNLAPAVAGGATPALATSDFQIVFKNTAPGAPLPDLVSINVPSNPPPPGFELLTLRFSATATGPLHAGFGVPEGTPGMLTVSQTGLIAIAGKTNSNSRVALDAFPAELVNLRVVGR